MLRDGARFRSCPLGVVWKLELPLSFPCTMEERTCLRYETAFATRVLI